MRTIKKEDVELVNNVKRLIDKEYFRHHTLADFAAIFATNENTLKIIFKAVTNENIHDYLTRVRVQKAIDLLQNSKLHIDQIASRVGLDRSNLCKRFKKLTGKTPTDFRKHPPPDKMLNAENKNAFNRTFNSDSPHVTS